MTLGLEFGALAHDLAKQLQAAGVKAKPADVKHWQKDADAVTRLSVRGLISDSAATAARRRLMKKIIAGVGVS